MRPLHGGNQIGSFVDGSLAHFLKKHLVLPLAKTAKSVWDALKEAYAQDSQGREFTLPAYDLLDPHGRIDIKWDVMPWTPDGYVAVVTINNNQMYRQIMSPGWTLGWTWAKKEVIWSMVGAQGTDQGDCSKFKGNIPHCCSRNPAIVDLPPGVPKIQQFSQCCKDGALASLGEDPAASVSSFQLSVGLSVSWTVTCSYSQTLASKYPKCCVSLSSFYNPNITPCPSCACGCQNENNCIITAKSDTPVPQLQCTNHMCPIQVHWHVKSNYKEHWRVKITITNFKYQMNNTQWTLVVQHPNLKNVTDVYRFVYKPLTLYESINDTGMFHGIKYYNDQLPEAGPHGNVQSELIFKKDKNTFTLERGWTFPLQVYFNGDECIMPPLDAYPFLPNLAAHPVPTLPASLLIILLLVSNLV
ncbi:hypothetical protein LWI28_011282 [Acer negundo]|uniref:COBRA-like protein n=1 Tax=Acer negundo TaxID=4023 RepID=A0AAD5IQR7_ACENE|nr:hypothetical protein LWI28_011282 [Acer negundo]